MTIMCSSPGAVRAHAGISRRLVLFAIVLWGSVFASRVASAATLSGDYEIMYTGSATNDLSAEGTLDWGYWGLVTEFSYCHKYGVAPQIRYSFITDWIDYPRWDGPFIVDWRWGGNYDFCWSDGTPVRYMDDAWNGVTIYGDRVQPDNNPVGFRLECPADTSPKTLRIYLGNSFGKADFVARLNGAPTYSDLWLDGTHGLNRVYTLQFQADSPGQTLTVEFTCTDPNWYITLQAASLSGTNAPPTVAISSPADGAQFNAPATFSLTATAADVDGVVTNLTLYRSGTVLADSPSGALTVDLTNQRPGTYDLLAVATDSGGLSMTSFPVRVNVTGLGGTLTGSVATADAFVDLTAQGPTDWAHWGLVTADSFNHRSGVVQQISNLGLLNAAPVHLLNFSDSWIAYGWTNGTPVAAISGTPTGVFLFTTNETPTGFEFKIPATQSSRTLKVYVGVSYAQGRLEAWLDDSSALPYLDTSLVEPDNNGNAVYTITFASPNPGANLVLRWTQADFFNLMFANVNLQAAALSGAPAGAPLRPILRVVDPPPANTRFGLAFPAQFGVSYAVEWTDNFGASAWHNLTNITGATGEVLVADPDQGPTQRYYRVSAQ